MPGKTASHQAEKLPLAEFNIVPQVTCSGGKPKPMNEMVDSNKMLFAMPNEAAVKIGVKMFGKA